MEKITWQLVEVEKDKIKVNPNNPKIRDEEGFERLKRSLESFGNVFDGILNADYTLIDGHSRLEVTNSKTGMYFMPSRQLTEKEYIEMNAMYDYSKAGDLDFEIIFETFDDDMKLNWEIEADYDSDIDISDLMSNENKNDELLIMDDDDLVVSGVFKPKIDTDGIKITVGNFTHFAKPKDNLYAVLVSFQDKLLQSGTYKETEEYLLKCLSK